MDRGCIDLLHALKDVESDHRISAWSKPSRFQPALKGTGDTPGDLSFPPLYRAVARSMTPHRIPCHRRANHRWFATPCGSGTALTESVASLRRRATELNLPENGLGVARPPPEDGGMRLLQYYVISLFRIGLATKHPFEGADPLIRPHNNKFIVRFDRRVRPDIGD